MAQVVDSARFDFITNLDSLAELVKKLKEVGVATKDLSEATKILSFSTKAANAESKDRQNSLKEELAYQKTLTEARRSATETQRTLTESQRANTEVEKARNTEARTATETQRTLTEAERTRNVEIRNTTATTRSSIAEIQKQKAELALQAKQLDLNSKSVKGYGDSLGSLKSFGTGALATLLGVSAVTDLSDGIINAQSQIQSFKLSLNALLGDKNIASGLFDEIKEFVKESPFQFENTVTSVQKLISSFKAVGKTAQEIKDETIPTLRSLGNSASALGLGDEGLKRLIYAFTQVQASGKLMGTEVRQVTETGLPLLQLLSEQTGIKVSNLAKEIKKGNISFEEFKKAVLAAGESTGVFAGLMDIQAQTISGRISNLKDTFFYGLGAIGDSLQGVAKDVISSSASIIDSLFGTKEAADSTISVMSTLATALGAYKLISSFQESAELRKAEVLAIQNKSMADQALLMEAEIALRRNLTLGIVEETAAINLNTQASINELKVGLESIIAKEAEIAETAKLIAIEELDIITKEELAFASELQVIRKQKEIIVSIENRTAILKEIEIKEAELVVAKNLMTSNAATRASKKQLIVDIQLEIQKRQQSIISIDEEILVNERLILEKRKLHLDTTKSIGQSFEYIKAINSEIFAIEREIVAIEQRIGIGRTQTVQTRANIVAIEQQTLATEREAIASTSLFGKFKNGVASLFSMGLQFAALTLIIELASKALAWHTKKQEEATMATLEGAIASSESAVKMQVQTHQVKSLMGSMNGLSESSFIYKKRVADMITQYPQYFKGLDVKNAKLKDLKERFDLINPSIQATITLMGQLARQDYFKKSIEGLQTSLAKAQFENPEFKNVDITDKNAVKKVQYDIAKSFNPLRGAREIFSGNSAASVSENLIELEKLLKQQSEFDKKTLESSIKASNAIKQGSDKVARLEYQNRLKEIENNKKLSSKEVAEAKKSAFDIADAIMEGNQKAAALRIRKLAPDYKEEPTKTGTRDGDAGNAPNKAEITKAKNESEREAKNLRSIQEQNLIKKIALLKSEEEQTLDIKSRILEAERDLDLKEISRLNKGNIERNKLVDRQNKYIEDEAKLRRSEKKKNDDDYLALVKSSDAKLTKLKEDTDKEIEKLDKANLKARFEQNMAEIDMNEDAALVLAKTEKEKFDIIQEYAKKRYELKRKALLDEMALLGIEAIQDNNNARNRRLSYEKELKDSKYSEEQKIDLMKRFDAIALEELNLRNLTLVGKQNVLSSQLNELDFKYGSEKIKNEQTFNKKSLEEWEKYTKARIERERAEKIARIESLRDFFKSSVKILGGLADAYDKFGDSASKANSVYIKNVITGLSSLADNLQNSVRQIKKIKTESLYAIELGNKQELDSLIAAQKSEYDERIKAGLSTIDLIAKHATQISSLKKNQANDEKKRDIERAAQTTAIVGDVATQVVAIVGATIVKRRQMELDAANAEIKALDKQFDLIKSKYEKHLKGIEDTKQASIDKNNRNAEVATKEVSNNQAKELVSLLNSSTASLKIVSDYNEKEKEIRDLYKQYLESSDAEERQRAEDQVEKLLVPLRAKRNADLFDLADFYNKQKEITKGFDNDKFNIQNEYNNKIKDNKRKLDEDIAFAREYWDGKSVADLEVTLSKIRDKSAQADTDALVTRDANLAKIQEKQKEALGNLINNVDAEFAINKSADDQIAELKTNSNGRSLEETNKLIDDVNTKRKSELESLRKDVGEEIRIKEEGATAIQKIEAQTAAANFATQQKAISDKKAADKQFLIDKYAHDLKRWEAEKKAIDASYKLQLQNLKVERTLASIQIGIQVAILTAKLATLSGPLFLIGIAAGIAAGVGLFAYLNSLPDPVAPLYPEPPAPPEFYQGTDNTSIDARKAKPRGKVDNRNGFRAILHPEEAVFNKSDMDEMTNANGGIRPTRKQVISGYQQYKNIALDMRSNKINPFIINGLIQSDKGLRDELKGLRSDLKASLANQKPSVSVNIDKDGVNVYQSQKNHSTRLMQEKFRIRL